MKKLTAVLLAALMLLPAALLPAAAETTAPTAGETAAATDEIPSPVEKTYAVAGSQDSLRFTLTPSDAVFWEAPYLEPGQYREGRFSLKNETTVELEFGLDQIKLPYADDSEAMQYLMAVHTVIRTDAGDTVYDGPFGLIMEKDGLRLQFDAFKPGETRMYDISMRCAFSYEGETIGANAPWEFYAKLSSESGPNWTGFWGILILIGIITAVFVVVAVAVYVVRRIMAKRVDRAAHVK